MITSELLKNRAAFEEKIRKLIGRPILLIELSILGFPCGCTEIAAYFRGLTMDDLEIFEPQLLIYLKEMAANFEVKPTATFAMVVPGSSIVKTLNIRVLCSRCYPEFARGEGKTPRPDLYLLQFERRK